MRQRAKNYKLTGGPASEEVAQLRREVAELRAAQHKAEVRPTTYNRPGGGAGVRVTNDNIDELFMGWERQHPNQSGNPYEDRYRKLMGE
jgi:hypothetical protein